MKRIIFPFLTVLLLLTGCKSKSKAVLETPDTYPLPIEASKPKTKPDSKRSLRDAIVEEAHRWVGTPYKYAGTTRQGTDCSGMVWAIYRDVAGIAIPRNSVKQFEYCRPLQRKELRPGDLVFFNTAGNGTRVGHVGIYIGNESFIHSSSSRGVRISTFDDPYYAKIYNRGGRVPELDK